jgi:hypothetical protein
MTDQTAPKFADILSLIDGLPAYPMFETQAIEPLAWLSDWMIAHSRTLDTSRGFDVNRCALYWAGYDTTDAFDGQSFVDSCQDSKGSLNKLAQMLDTDLQIFELDPQNHAPKTADDIALATSYGMMAVEESTQLFCACAFGQGVEANAQKLLSSFGLTKGSLDNQPDSLKLENFMTNHCGLDIAAMMGGAIASTMKGIPMILEGASGELAKTLLERTSGKSFPNLILAHEIYPNTLPAHNMIANALMVKMIWAGSQKTDCGKIKQVA